MIAVFALCFSTIGAHAAQAFQQSEFPYRKELQAMINVTKKGIDDGRWLDPPAGPIFNTNVDWHSAVHAHWALLRVARVLPDQQVDAKWVEKRLTPEGLKAEEKRLAGREDVGGFPYEYYGKAWFLRLAIEFEKWALETGAQDPQRMRGFADRVAEELFRFMNLKGPQGRTSHFGGHYFDESWALTHLYEYLTFTAKTDQAQRILYWVQSGYFYQNSHSFRYDNGAGGGSGFYSAYGNQIYLVAHTLPPAALDEFLFDHQFAADDLTKIPNPDSGGSWSAGYTWGCAWAFKAIADRSQDPVTRERALKAFHEWSAAGVKAGRFIDDWKYNHWVGQFGVYALTEGAVK